MKISRISALLWLAAITLVVFGCSDDEENSLSVSKKDLTFKPSGEKRTFTVYSNAEWQIDAKEEPWFSITPKRGKGDTEITVETFDNPGTKRNFAQITITSEYGSETVSITQEGVVLYFPLLYIETENRTPITSKDFYLNANLIIRERDHTGTIVGDNLFEGKTEIKGRGNSTWDMPKKPYRLKLDKSSKLLDMPKSKHWVLLANYSDKTLMRNELAFEISRRMEFAYTPRTKYVDVVINGKNAGNYQLCEHIRIDKDRVNVEELSPEDTDITGGYLLEIDERMGEPIWFRTNEAGMVFCVKRPEDIPDNQKNYIAAHVQKVENAIYGKLGETVAELPKYLDLKSFIDYFLLNEMSKNVDGNLRLSSFVYKDRGDDKLYFGPVWDYDIAFGNVNYQGCDQTSGWYTIDSGYAAPWYTKFFEHDEFRKMAKDRWAELRKTKLSNMNEFIDNLAYEMKTSQTKNFSYWPILNQQVWPNPIVTGSYDGEIGYLKRWLQARVDWMDKNL